MRRTDDATALDAEPSLPVRRRRDTNVCHARIAVAAFEHLEGRRHAPARHDDLAPLGAVADDQRRVVEKDPRKRRHVADVAARRPHEISDRLGALGEAVEVAHRRRLRNDRGIEAKGGGFRLIYDERRRRLWAAADRKLPPTVGLARTGFIRAMEPPRGPTPIEASGTSTLARRACRRSRRCMASTIAQGRGSKHGASGSRRRRMRDKRIVS